MAPAARWAIVGDRTGGAQPGVYERVWEEVAAWQPDLVISIGDTIQGGDDATVVPQWDDLDRRVFSRYRSIPFYHVAGNHDVFSAHSEREYLKRQRRGLRYSFRHKGALFVVLDNSRADSLPAADMAFCAKELQAEADAKFVFLHRPSWLFPVRLRVTGDPFHKLMVRHRVSHVFSGHVHQLLQLELDGVRYSMVGSSGGSLERGVQARQGEKEGWFFQWMQVVGTGTRVKKLGSTAQVVDIDRPAGPRRG